MPRKRTDAERRARQCERLSRLIRVLRLIMGPGRWDAEALAGELECSTRTVHRILQTLSMAGIPWFFDDDVHAYRVRPGFKFPALQTGEPAKDATMVLGAAKRLLDDSERFVESLHQFCDAMAAADPRN